MYICIYIFEDLNSMEVLNKYIHTYNVSGEITHVVASDHKLCYTCM